MKEVFIIAAKRTAIGGYLGSLASYTATELGAEVVKKTMADLLISMDTIDSIYMGNVLSAGVGQSPARQVGIFSGIPAEKDATTINKVCASGLKATIIAAQQIQLGIENCVVSGGMESMSNVPHYGYFRKGKKLGDFTLVDGMTKDGLWDVYHDYHMGNAAEMSIKQFGFSRKELDAYALLSYQRAQLATEEGKFQKEIIELPLNNTDEMYRIDEDVYKVIPEKMAKLQPVFEKEGLLTAANSSNLNDGAAVLILASKEIVQKYNLKPLAKILGYADAARTPEWFTTAPSLAIPKALEQAKLTLDDIDFFEINEAYASVILSNQKLLNLPTGKININGGAIALGHPIGASGARILVTLIHILQQQNAKFGVASICNGGGGSSAIVIENCGN